MTDNETKTIHDGDNSSSNNDGAAASKSSKKKSKKNRKRKSQPKPGDPDYKTPTQLRNARKRRKKKQEKASETSHESTTNTRGNNNTPGTISSSSKGSDPSLKYLSNPRAAPTVRNAIRFFREKTNADPGTNHDVYFPVTLGPKIGWRTVARLAVRVQQQKNDETKKRLGIGLFVPGSHELLPVPDCPVHNRRINGLVKVLEDECNALEVPAFENTEGAASNEGSSNEDDDYGLRYIAVAVERSTQKQQLVLVWKESENKKNKNKNSPDDLVERLVALSRDKNKKDVQLHSIWIHYNNTWKHANSIFDRVGRWETRFVDGGEKEQQRKSDNNDDPLYGSIREVVLPLTTKTSKNATADASSSSTNSSRGGDIHVPLYFPPQVFRQANLDGFANIVLRIREWLQEKQQSNELSVVSSASQSHRAKEDDYAPKRKRRRGKRDTSNASQQQREGTVPMAGAERRSLGHCLELYGGVGTIGLNLVDFFDSLDSSDENPFNELCFGASADEMKIRNAPLDPSKRKNITYTSKSASDIVTNNFASLEKAGVVVVDPPRKGLDPPVIEALCSDYNNNKFNKNENENEQHQALIYVSCGFDAFRRDYRALVEHSGKWSLDRAEGHILFPGSDAIETLAFFVRKK